MAKEGALIKAETRTYASVTFQNLFRMYERLAGMTGTALSSEEEFYTVYGLEVVAVPTNKPVARRDFDDLVFQTAAGKYRAVARAVKEKHLAGQPVLVGTVSIEDNEVVSRCLTDASVPHEVLNYLPFAALRDRATERYLMQDYTIRILPSAATLPALSKCNPHSRVRPKKRVFAMSPSRSGWVVCTSPTET